jgi:hypothetical protein
MATAVENGKSSFDLISSYTGGEAVTPNDTVPTEFTKFARALWIGTTGHVKLITTDGTTLTLNSVPVGELKVQCKQVLSTGTTASNIVALW